MSLPLPKVCVITHSPSPYQVELFDAVARGGELDLEVIYLYQRDAQRLWEDRVLEHEHAYYEAKQMGRLVGRVAMADLWVMNYYKHPLVDEVIKARDPRRPWVFWGERPHRHALERLSRLYRSWKLRTLHWSRAPIWGIGQMAVTAYRAEFGVRRAYVNLPYFSNLKRFEVKERKVRAEDRVLLFSGSLIERKGVDLVVRAFARLMRKGVRVRLRIMGAGELEGALRSALRDYLAHVEFIGFQDWQALPAAYACADVLCVPSRYDGWGLVVPEGLAAGLPVISTTQTGAAVEFLEAGHNGWLIPPDDELALYEAMRDASTMATERLVAMSQAAVESVSAHHLENGAQRFVEAAKAAIKG